MTAVASPRTVRLDRPELSVTVAAIRDAVERGAGSPIVEEWTAEATRENGDGRDRLAVLRLLAARVRSTVTFGFDEYGGEDVQDVETTLSTRRVGDCDDFAVAVLALARRIGLRPGIAIGYVNGRPRHVVPLVELPGEPGRWIPIELTIAVPFGEFPKLSSSIEWDGEPLQLSELGTEVGGIFDLILGPILGFFGQKETNKAAKSVAKTNLQAAEVQAKAATDVAREARAAAAAQTSADLRKFSASLDFAKKALPMVAGVFALAFAAPLVADLLKPRRAAPRPRAVPA